MLLSLDSYRDLVEQTLHETTDDHAVVLGHLAVLALLAWCRQTGIIAKLLQDLLESDELDQDHVVILLVLKLDREVTGGVHLEVLLRVDRRKVDSIHEVVEIGLPVCEVLSGQLAVLNFWVEGLLISCSLGDISETLPVENSADEVKSFLQILVECVKDNFVKVLETELTFRPLACSLA